MQEPICFLRQNLTHFYGVSKLDMKIIYYLKRDVHSDDEDYNIQHLKVLKRKRATTIHPTKYAKQLYIILRAIFYFNALLHYFDGHVMVIVKRMV